MPKAYSDFRPEMEAGIIKLHNIKGDSNIESKWIWNQGSHGLEKYLNLDGFLEKSLKIVSALKSAGKSLKVLEKSLNASIFCRT